jgi:hydrogenase nickel incorporation protein HypA/HybF
MHELGIAMSIVSVTSERCRRESGTSIARIRLEIGALAMIEPDALRFAFEVASQGTEAEGADLELTVVPALARCRACSREMTLDDPLGQCTCGSIDLAWISGQQMTVKDMEIA